MQPPFSAAEADKPPTDRIVFWSFPTRLDETLMTIRLAAGAVAATCSVILLASCSGGSQSASAGQSASTSAAGGSSTTSAAPSTSSTPPAAGASSAAATTAVTAKITIKDFKYQVPASVKPGQNITVTNSDNINHTLTSDKGSLFDAKVDSNGGTKTFTAPTKPGTYPFHCDYHANMHGTLVVS